MNIDQVIRYKSRRGMLELDLVLNEFYEQGYADLNFQEKETLLKILKKQDQDLWADLCKKSVIELINLEKNV